nr:Rep [Kummerowia striata CRESS virus]
MPFQINSRRLFLTYPQCTLSKATALEALEGIFPDIEEYIVAHELHANGDHHIHVYLKLGDNALCRWRDPHFADLRHPELGTFHGNYQGCRSAKNVIKYCTKEEDYLSNIDVALLLGKKTNRTIVAAKLIREKRPLEELIAEEHPELIFGYSKLKFDLDNYFQATKQEKEDLPDYLPNPWGLQLAAKIQTKKRHYWIYSRRPDVGKTFKFAKPLSSKYKACIATNFTYWSIPFDTELLILDEYNSAGLKWNELNQLCDNTFGFRVFQGGIRYMESYLVIILSNLSIKEMYPFKYEFLEARFNEIEIL